MEQEAEKCVMILDGELPLGLLANTAAILGITLGKCRPETVGSDVPDKSGALHRGIIRFPVPVLRGNRELLKELRRKLSLPEYTGLTTADFTDLAQGCKTYAEYQEKMSTASEDGLSYLGIALCGSKKLINRLTGSLPLLR